MDKNKSWLEEFGKSEVMAHLKVNPIAYFCAEYALLSNLPIYAGGLGVLAGDLMREASDFSLPLVAVGLYYNDGYETLHDIDEAGHITAPHVHRPPQTFGLEPTLGHDGKPVTVTIPIEGRTITVRAWNWRVGTIPVYLLYTDCEENSAEDRKITDHLYVMDRQTRLKQEIVLGIGGVKMLKALGIEPALFHMNDGHPSLLSYEVIKDFMQTQKLNFEEAAKAARNKIVFSNHTLVAGGQEIFNNDLMSLALSDYANEMGVPMQDFLSLGRVQDANSFSLTSLSLKVAGITNTVSKIHSRVAKNIWPDYALPPITNGIHIPTWDAVNEDELWALHLENKKALLAKIRLLRGIEWNNNDLIVGWARRLVEYKRPMALLEDVTSLKIMLEDKNRPFKIIFSGRLHPSDIATAKLLEEFHRLIQEDLKEYAIFMPEYDLDLAKLLVAGCDIWVNTPIVGFEACGTSGMKAALNGVLPVSTRDGWIDEIELLDKGWAVEDNPVNQSLLGILKNEVLPTYFDRNEQGIPINWVRNMKNCRELIKNEFSATRMLKEYIEKLYLPLLTQKG